MSSYMMTDINLHLAIILNKTIRSQRPTAGLAMVGTIDFSGEKTGSEQSGR